ncbi:MAG: AAA family ATPase [Candidatus Krumholzibacteria bacterium]|nr:AAA family ATPase [Candidatus Krumholzibacteria bacterium]
MHVKALRVDRYGPLRQFSDAEIKAFNLIYGANELGKTLLIDAILRLLFKKYIGSRAKVFDNITRVDELPEGYIVLDLDGQEIKIDRSDSVTKHITITPTDFRNIFVVRDSDLSMVNQDKYFTDVTEKLAGLRTSEISKIKKALQEKGWLTSPASESDLANSIESGHARGKVEAARGFIEEIEQLSNELDARDFERLEQTLAGTRDTLAEHRHELSLLINSQLRARYLEARSQLDELKRIAASVRRLTGFNDNDLETWSHHARDLSRLQDELDEAKQELAQYKAQLGALEAALTDKRARAVAMQERQRRIEDLLEPKILSYESLRRARAHDRPRDGLWKWGSALASGALLLSLVGVIIYPTIFLSIVTTALLLSSGGFVWRFLSLRSGEAQLARAWDELSVQAARLGFDASSLETLLRLKGEFDREFDQAIRAADEVVVNLEAHKKHIDSLDRRVHDGRGKVDDIERATASFKRLSGVGDPREYQRALQEKKEYLYQIRSLEALLKQALGTGGDDDTSFWERDLDHLLADLGEDTGITYDAGREEHLREEIDNLEKRLADTEQALSTGRQALRDLESKVAGAGIIRDVVCRTSGELNRLGQQLGEYIETILERRDDVRRALAIFEAIESEEKAKVVELFGEGTSVAAYFKRITGGQYFEVRFDPATVEISVVTKDGVTLTAEKLSGGAFDQLYLAIRLSIAESIMGDRRGFFIFDDPFVKSDISRLKNQLELLRTIAASGWQILYFSAKKEVYDLMKADISAGRVKLITLDIVGTEPSARPPTRPVARSPADLFSDGYSY